MRSDCAGLAGLCELAEEFVGSSPRPTARALAIHLLAAAEADRPEEASPEPGEPLSEVPQTTLQMMREEVLGDVARIAGRLGELRLDMELDVSHGVVRYLELLKLAALRERPEGEAVEEALLDVNARLSAAMTPLQREIYESSPLDELLLQESRAQGGGVELGEHARAQALAARDEPTLEAFLPRRGRAWCCRPRMWRPTGAAPCGTSSRGSSRSRRSRRSTNALGSWCTRSLERFHAAEGLREQGAEGEPQGPGESQPMGEAGVGGAVEREQGTLQELLDLLDVAWRRSGIGDGARERELRQKARGALTRYHERLREEPAQPVWFERSFAFDLGPPPRAGAGGPGGPPPGWGV